jgi:hypothetical protein
MAENDRAGQGPKQYEVKDRRAFTPEGELRTEAPPAPEPAAPPPAPDPAPAAGEREIPPIEFGQFILSLATAVLFHLGDAHEEGKEPPPPNLPLAKETIDIITMLQEKTKGNLTKTEEAFIEGLLFDLRMRYVAKVNKTKVTV